MARFYHPKKKTQPDSKHKQVRVERLDHHGAGIAYLNKKPVFIEGALPGENALIQLTESKSKYSRAKLIKNLSASKERVAPFCPYYKECGGCNLQHLKHSEQLKYKQQSLEQLIKKFSGEERRLEQPIAGESMGYRRRARISLMQDKKNGTLQFGFRQKKSNAIVNISHCAALLPELEALLEPLKQLLTGLSNRANLGHLELVQGKEQSVVLLRVIKDIKPAEREKLVAFAEEKQLSFYLHAGDEPLQRLSGEQPYYDEAGAKIPFLPNNFIQVNQHINQKMVEQAMEWLQLASTDRVLDLFCGLGNFSLPVARKADQVVGVEGVQEMVDMAQNNAHVNGIDNSRFYQANLAEDLSAQPWFGEKFDKIILDPARAGASGVVEQLSQTGAKRIVYVSCNPATLARDSQSLLEQGYKLSKLAMLDMFPHTSHLESMALFEK
ncbi:23S rRNA (uracil(1939)-C(5))-methyltransferase RlmD [Vibrio sp. SCSIO 43137]|uniref:23S rRNA (uracil(1939)-C(5))-methyltransferase RlmD n=1 Tax=Vibrio sp. SCSIO 43137 TaxID=3021011 RepID=UPI0023070F13|nr:23S rRNA (uracil(1939)-C(5))-methyltransferase RlmD [Vibrio sp. SCSIO 43137]WCE30177.1 23S rRNA (uracil(1939)-C(5))-methyltransferase RlmD [Vibrio sp. SCSIO 43137]